MANCPECEGEIDVQKGVEVGELLSCPECGSELEVRSITPIKLEKAPEEEEDWGE